VERWDIEKMASEQYLVDRGLHEYLLSVSLHEPEIMARLRRETARHPRRTMQTAADQAQFLALLVRAIGAVRTLEVGVFTGYSSLAVALALPPQGRLVACDVSEEYTSVARRYWTEAGVEHKIDLRLGPALATLESLVAAGESGSFDFAFIDADKLNTQHYYEFCLRLIRPGGLIAVDNVLQHGAIVKPEVSTPSVEAMRRFNDMLYRDRRVEISMLTIADGLTLALKR
jgi:predicted O-methyltransferase YrrM